MNLLIGNSSLAHMGFAFLGIASLTVIGVTGTVLLMVAHALLAGLSFALSGYLETQTGTLDMTRMGGLLRRMPFYGTALVMGFMAGCGLPGFANFAGEATILFGSWKSLPLLVVIAAWSGLVIGAVAMLRALRAVLHGPEKPEFARVADTGLWRRLPFVVLLVALVLFGLAPGLLTSRIEPAARAVVAAHVKPSEAATPPAAASGTAPAPAHTDAHSAH